MAYRTEKQSSIDKLQPPQSLDAEQAVLGSILKDPDAVFTAIEEIIDPSVFYYPKHQLIYRAILKLYERTEPCDITTVSDILQKDDSIDKIGGRVYLVDLVETIASTANIVSHCKIVLEKYVLRKLVERTQPHPG